MFSTIEWGAITTKSILSSKFYYIQSAKETMQLQKGSIDDDGRMRGSKQDGNVAEES